MNLSEKEAQEILDSLKFDRGLIPAVVRNFKDKEILMLAFMNRDAIMKTLTSGIMHYWSRKREEIWQKGEESGNRQEVREMRVDCDRDALLFDVDPEGPACHKGYRSCFYRKVENGSFSEIIEQEFNPEKVYG